MIDNSTPWSNHLVIAFENQEQAHDFKTWLCLLGDQDFRNYCAESNADQNQANRDILTFEYYMHPNAIAAYFHDEKKYPYDPNKTPKCYQRVMDLARKLAEIIIKRNDNG
jgi:hypothetical protein